MPGENETGIFNNVTEPRILDFNIPIFRVYRASVPLYFAHYTVGDCTHFCNGDKGPMDHDNALLLALLKNAIEGNLLPPLPDERNSSSGYSIEKRWEMLMEHPTDSLMAKLDVCAPMHDSSKHHNWEVDKHGPIPEVLEECLRRSEAIHSSR
ncbi:unnamed protein product [Cylindrotheca closterium]|uniref:Uncharacterized protein n=1 Tax=Cylindrotheca closterium TaxID=2856 RepID=A0AAD2JHN1_9STRA|nr:unnamed protein product [Cylindrotheca closterium]